MKSCLTDIGINWHLARASVGHMRPTGGVGRWWCAGQWGGGATVAVMVSVMRAVTPHCASLYTVMDAEHHHCIVTLQYRQHRNTLTHTTLLPCCKLILSYQRFCQVVEVLDRSKNLTNVITNQMWGGSYSIGVGFEAVLVWLYETGNSVSNPSQKFGSFGWQREDEQAAMCTSPVPYLPPWK